MPSKILSFFSTQAGKKKIQAGQLSQIELFIYFYMITLFDCFGLTQQTLDMIGKTPSFIDYLTIWQVPIVSAIGLIVLFLFNGGRKGKDFLSKFFTFSFTVGIKYYVLILVLAYLPTLFPALAFDHYEISLIILLNIVMVANIGLRIYQTKT